MNTATAAAVCEQVLAVPSGPYLELTTGTTSKTDLLNSFRLDVVLDSALTGAQQTPTLNRRAISQPGSDGDVLPLSGASDVLNTSKKCLTQPLGVCYAVLQGMNKVICKDIHVTSDQLDMVATATQMYDSHPYYSFSTHAMAQWCPPGVLLRHDEGSCCAVAVSCTCAKMTNAQRIILLHNSQHTFYHQQNSPAASDQLQQQRTNTPSLTAVAFLAPASATQQERKLQDASGHAWHREVPAPAPFPTLCLLQCCQVRGVLLLLLWCSGACKDHKQPLAGWQRAKG